MLVENSEALDDLQFNPTQVDVLTNVVGAIGALSGQIAATGHCGPPRNRGNENKSEGRTSSETLPFSMPLLARQGFPALHRALFCLTTGSLDVKADVFRLSVAV